MSTESDPAGPGDPAEGGELVAYFRVSRGGATARFGREEAAILRELVEGVAELISDEPAEPGSADELAAMVGMSDNSELPEDPILARLLPDGYSDDPDAAGEFRRYTESGLRSAKTAAAQVVLNTLPAAGGRVRLSADEAEQWLRSLNDIRLALGVSLDVTEDFDQVSEQISASDPRFPQVIIYQWLSYLQESLVLALSDHRLRSPEC